MPSRRALLGAAAATPFVPRDGLLPRAASSGENDRENPPSKVQTVTVHVHRDSSVDDATRRRVARNVRVGLDQVTRVASNCLDRDVDYDVSTGSTAPADRIGTTSRTAVFDTCRNWLDETDALALDAVHLLLLDNPLAGSIGYGGNRTHLFDGGPVSYANVGATDRWDDATVTANIAVHEVLHALVTSREVEAVLGRGCEHDLGAIYPAGDGGAIVTPFATAYASQEVGGDTRWPGSGCLGGFSQDVRFEPDWWGHTYALSPATLDATTQYLGR